jgi:hypothetical protein
MAQCKREIEDELPDLQSTTYTLQRVLSQSSCGVVYEAKVIETGEIFSIKSVSERPAVPHLNFEANFVMRTLPLPDEDDEEGRLEEAEEEDEKFEEDEEMEVGEEEVEEEETEEQAERRFAQEKWQQKKKEYVEMKKKNSEEEVEKKRKRDGEAGEMVEAELARQMRNICETIRRIRRLGPATPRGTVMRSLLPATLP